MVQEAMITLSMALILLAIFSFHCLHLSLGKYLLNSCMCQDVFWQ